MSTTRFVDSPPADAWERIKQEPQLFQQLLTCSRTDDIDALLLSAVTYARERVGAAEGFIALYEDGARADSVPRWCAVSRRRSKQWCGLDYVPVVGLSRIYGSS